MDYPYFDLNESVELELGDRVLAFGNLYGIASGNEQSSLMHGFVSAIAPLAARRGVYETPYDGPVYVVDAMTNNAGAAGGALTDYQGNLAGVLGKELRSSLTNVWLNYAVPVEEIRTSAQGIIDGISLNRERETTRRPEDPVTLAGLGLVLLPQIIARTPAYVERVLAGQPATVAGIQTDDLIVMVEGHIVQSRHDVITELSRIDRLDPVRLTIMRGSELLEIELVASPSPRLLHPANRPNRNHECFITSNVPRRFATYRWAASQSCCPWLRSRAQGDDLIPLQQQAVRAAANSVADSVVQIETLGGLERSVACSSAVVRRAVWWSPPMGILCRAHLTSSRNPILSW